MLSIYQLSKLFCSFTVAAVCILLEVGALPSRRSGFTCNDPALSFPYMGDTFTISLVAAITVIVPFLIVSHLRYNPKFL